MHEEWPTTYNHIYLGVYYYLVIFKEIPRAEKRKADSVIKIKIQKNPTTQSVSSYFST